MDPLKTTLTEIPMTVRRVPPSFPVLALSLLDVLAAGAPLVAQEETPNAPPPEAAPAEPEAEMSRDEALAAMRRAVEKMRALQGVEFKTTEEQNDSMTRRFAQAIGSAEVAVDGRWAGSDGLLVYIGNDEVVMRGDRMIARDDASDWVLRRGCLAGGGDLPFVFDPARFFEVFPRLDSADVRTTRHAMDPQGRLVITLEIGEEASDELLLTGCVPRVRGMGAVVTIGGLGANLPRPRTHADLSFAIDPEAGLIRSMHVNAYQTNPFGGFVNAQGIEDGDLEDEPEPIRTKDEHGNQIYEHGLPLRVIADDESVMSFGVRFENHDKPIRIDLDEDARRLLEGR